ncbi:MAG: LamG-like jellyroll fold domain-containing protein, partial [Rhodospirillales bacterium]
RFTGARFEFDGVLTDENGNAATYTPGSATYVASTFDKALVIAAADHVTIPRVPVTNAPRLVPGEGCIVLVVKPAFAGTDAVLHTFLDSGGPTTNRLRIRKTVANTLEFEILDTAAGSKKIAGAVSWAANAEQSIVAVYQSDGTMQLFLNNAPFGTTSGAGTGQLASLGTTIFLGADTGGLNRAAGDVERLALFTKGYTMNASLADVLKKAVSTERNYYAKAELIQPTNPARTHNQVELYHMPLAIRKSA